MVWRPPGGWRPALRRLGRGAVKALRLPPRELATTLHAVVMIAVVEVLIRPVRLERLARLLGLRVDFSPAQPGAGRLPVRELPPLARRQVRCTGRVADAWPFSRGPCLRRSLVLGHLLRRLSPALRFGVAGSGDEFYAHAWLEIGDRPLEDVAGFNTFQYAASETVE